MNRASAGRVDRAFASLCIAAVTHLAGVVLVQAAGRSGDAVRLVHSRGYVAAVAGLLAISALGYVTGVIAALGCRAYRPVRVAGAFAVVSVVTSAIANGFTAQVQELSRPLFWVVDWAFLVAITVVLLLGARWIQERGRISLE